MMKTDFEITSKYIKSLTPEKRTKFIKEISDELLEIQGVINNHSEYLEQLPTKEIRIKEQLRIIKNYRNDRRTDN